MKKGIENCLTSIWFFAVVIETVLAMFLITFGVIFFRIIPMIHMQTTMHPKGFYYGIFVSIALSLTGILPEFRKCYYKYPWLYPLCMIEYIYLILVATVETILSRGYLVLNAQREKMVFDIVIAVIILWRVMVCCHFKRKPLLKKKRKENTTRKD